MERRKLGNSGYEIGPLVFGGNVFGWTADEQTSFALLDEFLASGFNMIDTADVYSSWVPGHKGGESETIIGRWMKERGNRQKVLVATKVGSDMGQGKNDLSKKWILQACEDSLRRLQTDYIDLYQSHLDDPETPVEETLEAYSELVKSGKVRVIGASNLPPDRLRKSIEVSRSHGWPEYRTLQPNYSMAERMDYENNYEPVAQMYGLGVVPYFSLASGFLAGKYRSEKDLEGRARAMMVKKYLNERGYRILAALDEVAKETGANVAQIAIAWLLHRPSVTAPIVSATSVQQWKELTDATRLKLSADQLNKLNVASA